MDEDIGTTVCRPDTRTNFDLMIWNVKHKILSQLMIDIAARIVVVS